jgi:hypothetical protein
MDRLTEKLALAASVVSTQTTLLENDADVLIARGAEFSRRRSATFAAQHAILDEGAKGMDALDAKLALLSNDPLTSSGGSSVAQPEPVLAVVGMLGPNEPITAANIPRNIPAPNETAGFQPMHQTMARAVPSRRDL